MSDLDLVAAAMAPTNQPQLRPTSPPTQTTSRPNGMPRHAATSDQTRTPPAPNPTFSSQPSDLPSELQDLDLSSLSPAELALLQPLIDALRISENGDDVDELGMEEILRQMEVADGVADELEGRLDGLLERLGGLGQEIEGGLGEGGEKAVAGSLDRAEDESSNAAEKVEQHDKKGSKPS